MLIRMIHRYAFFGGMRRRKKRLIESRTRKTAKRFVGSAAQSHLKV